MSEYPRQYARFIYPQDIIQPAGDRDRGMENGKDCTTNKYTKRIVIDIENWTNPFYLIRIFSNSMRMNEHCLLKLRET